MTERVAVFVVEAQWSGWQSWAEVGRFGTLEEAQMYARAARTWLRSRIVFTGGRFGRELVEGG